MNSAGPSYSKILTLQEAAQKLAVSVEKLLEWNEHNILKPTITVEGKIVYTEAQIDQFLFIQKILQSEVSPVEQKPLTPQTVQTTIFSPPPPPTPTPVEVAPPHHETQSGVIRGRSTPAYPNFKMKTPGAKLFKTSHVVTSGLVILFIVLIGMFTQSDLQFLMAQSKHSQDQALNTDKSSKMKLSEHTFFGFPIPFKNDAQNDTKLHIEGKDSLKSKMASQSTNSQGTSSNSNAGTQQARLTNQKQQNSKLSSKTNSNTANDINEIPLLSIFASKTNCTDCREDKDAAIDAKGNIKGEAKSNNLATAIGAVDVINNGSFKPVSGGANMQLLVLLTLGFAGGIFVFRKQFAYAGLRRQPVRADDIPQMFTTQKVLEVAQKTDGTVMVHLNGKEYKISKPELYSESDQFIERLMTLSAGMKELDYDSVTDDKLKLMTPLSRLVTRLGFVGIKRELFFPRTSKDRVLFRRYITDNDLSAMNLSVDQISRELLAVA